SRWVESDAGFRLVAAAALVRPGHPQLLPTATDVVESDPEGSTRYVVSADGGLEPSALTPLATLPAGWRNDTVFGTLSGTSLCLEPLDGGGTATDACQKLSGVTASLVAFGADTGGIWASEMLTGGTVIHRIAPDEAPTLALPRLVAPMST